jgi:hypothetical protein
MNPLEEFGILNYARDHKRAVQSAIGKVICESSMYTNTIEQLFSVSENTMGDRIDYLQFSKKKDLKR